LLVLPAEANLAIACHGLVRHGKTLTGAPLRFRSRFLARIQQKIAGKTFAGFLSKIFDDNY
jgi:hypothetical protein